MVFRWWWQKTESDEIGHIGERQQIVANWRIMFPILLLQAIFISHSVEILCKQYFMASKLQKLGATFESLVMSFCYRMILRIEMWKPDLVWLDRIKKFKILIQMLIRFTLEDLNLSHYLKKMS
jgi:hypothetical protein